MKKLYLILAFGIIGIVLAHSQTTEQQEQDLSGQITDYQGNISHLQSQVAADDDNKNILLATIDKLSARMEDAIATLNAMENSTDNSDNSQQNMDNGV